jgi:hypothetical protein
MGITDAAAFAGFGFTVASVMGSSLKSARGRLSPAAAENSRWLEYNDSDCASQQKYCDAQKNVCAPGTY